MQGQLSDCNITKEGKISAKAHEILMYWFQGHLLSRDRFEKGLSDRFTRTRARREKIGSMKMSTQMMI